MAAHTEAEAICCPEFHPEKWEDRIIEWDNKTFVKGSVFTLFYMPMNFGSVIRKIDKKITEAGAEIIDNLCLSDHTSKWNMDIYLAVNKPVPDAENKMLSGKFYSRVYEGPYKDTGKWCKNFESEAKTKGYNIKKWYMWYTTCPKCAKKYGKNYVAIISQVE